MMTLKQELDHQMSVNKHIKRAQHIATLKEDLYKLLRMVGDSKTVSSFKIFPGETILVTLYSKNGRLADYPIGQFALEEAIVFMEARIRMEKESRDE